MKLCLAPMDGITDCAYRTVVNEIWQKYGDHNHELLTFSEFMSVEWYVRNPRKLIKHMVQIPQYNTPFIGQIYGWNESNLIQTAIDLEQRYGHLLSGIELNIWCPSPKVMKGWGWAGMMCERPTTLQTIEKIKKSITLPFSIKTRAWLNVDDKDEQFEFIKEISQFCHMITIHGRTYKQSHSGEVDRNYIYATKSALPNMTIIGNGWLQNYQDWLDHIGNLDGVMRWQAAMMRPRVLTSYTPTIEEIYHTIFRHLHLSMAHQIWFDDEAHFLEDSRYTGQFIQPTQNQIEEIITQIPHKYADTEFHSIVEFRKHLFRYVTGLQWNKEFKQSVVPIKSYGPLRNAIEELWSKQ